MVHRVVSKVDGMLSFPVILLHWPEPKCITGVNVILSLLSLGDELAGKCPQQLYNDGGQYERSF